MKKTLLVCLFAICGQQLHAINVINGIKKVITNIEQKTQKNPDMCLGLMGVGLTGYLYGLYKTHNGISLRVNNTVMKSKKSISDSYQLAQEQIVKPAQHTFKRMQDEELTFGYVGRVGLTLATAGCLYAVHNNTNLTGHIASGSRDAAKLLTQASCSTISKGLETAFANKNRSALSVLVTAAATYGTLKYLEVKKPLIM